MVSSELKTQTGNQRQPISPLHIQIWLHIWCIILMGNVITMYLINEQSRSKFFVWRCICNKLLTGRKSVVVVAQQHLGSFTVPYILYHVTLMFQGSLAYYLHLPIDDHLTTLSANGWLNDFMGHCSRTILMSGGRTFMFDGSQLGYCVVIILSFLFNISAVKQFLAYITCHFLNNKITSQKKCILRLGVIALRNIFSRA